MRPITPIALMISGSCLYGSNIAGSDRDYTGVHLPSGRGILLGRPESVLASGTKATLPPAEGGIGSARIRPTAPDEIDRESHALGKIFDMLRGGHMVAVDLLFVPESDIILSDPIWSEVRAHRDRLVSRDCRGFVGYARKQAEMYGRKATRLGEIEQTHVFLQRMIAERGADAFVGDVAGEVEGFVAGKDHIAVEPHDCGYSLGLPHLVIAGKRVAYTHRLSVALHVVESRIKNYGRRALAAQEGTDWKSVAHAVRIAHQAIELLTTGTITFPRPEAAYMREIRYGQHHRKAVGLEIDRLLEEVDRVAAQSTLRAEPDSALMDELQFAAYARQMQA